MIPGCRQIQIGTAPSIRLRGFRFGVTAFAGNNAIAINRQADGTILLAVPDVISNMIISYQS